MRPGSSSTTQLMSAGPADLDERGERLAASRIVVRDRGGERGRRAGRGVQRGRWVAAGGWIGREAGGWRGGGVGRGRGGEAGWWGRQRATRRAVRGGTARGARNPDRAECDGP